MFGQPAFKPDRQVTKNGLFLIRVPFDLFIVYFAAYKYVLYQC